MSKTQCKLNHSRNLSTSYKKANYDYDRERSRATAKQIKFYQSLWYIFKENNLNINEELDKKGIEHSIVQNPSGRCGYSTAISYMLDILQEHGLYSPKTDKRNNFVNTYNYLYKNKGDEVRAWEKIEYVGTNEGG